MTKHFYIYNLCLPCTSRLSDDADEYDVKRIQTLMSPFRCEFCKQMAKSGATWKVTPLIDDDGCMPLTAERKGK